MSRMNVEFVLINGERRKFTLPGHTGSVVSALDRLDDWIQASDGVWVQKKFIVEVRLLDEELGEPPRSAEQKLRVAGRDDTGDARDPPWQ
jgi:hypothetical protein